ncbi:precorrin-6y C5,15-methyltransferase (decarboxylating) subunit CbiE [uncultured Sanguibacteroides sp.]|uniref:precorrin-6y C5,15-methyltransferase (decarboxylating) subunit CbiE n=1 Tax=uncultured Sanguibacteroides sp. TaxID=1635151 RepID=UPI0025E7DFA6|nr:precorrin-6y C5,15-methyltransferase (decarboxylating) subunit CbiE [uncultured Sanguibacteroides sp.]
MKFIVIGLDDNKEPDFNEHIRSLINSHSVFSGGKRHHDLVKNLLPPDYTWIDITVPLDNVFRQYTLWGEMVVFASGDPLFFGFATTIQKRLPQAKIILYPYFNSLQILSHRLLLPYHDMHTVSLTGRPWHEFDRALIEGKRKIGILTDREKTPPTIAQRMLEFGYDNYQMTVGELLGNSQERIRTFSLPEVNKQEFQFPNCIILEQTYPRERPFGIPEEEFHLLNGRSKMITKMPIRLLSLSMLDLRSRQHLWDIGFCTGSVSIEAKLQFPHLHITAFEQREEGKELIYANSQKFGTPGIDTIIGDFTTTDLTGISYPDAVFIGGHGGKMHDILHILSEKIVPESPVVFNSVSEESERLFIAAAEQYGFTITGRHRIAVDQYNPIEIIQATKNS